MSYIHESWFTKSQLKNKTLHRMCKFCGNDNQNVMSCQNCDVGFANYIYLEDK